MSEKNLAGKVAVITGAGGTLCSVMALDLASRGADRRSDRAHGAQVAGSCRCDPQGG